MLAIRSLLGPIAADALALRRGGAAIRAGLVARPGEP
jgi:hypothetical protein